MNLYIAHSRGFDFEAELYQPIHDSQLLAESEIVFPHTLGACEQNSYNLIANTDLLIAEVSYPSTSLGIELSRAHNLNINILAIHKKEAKISGSIKYVVKDIKSYDRAEDIPKLIHEKILTML